jgi:hypothetical protein
LPNGAKDEIGENQQSKKAAVLVLPDSVNGVPGKRQLYLTTISYALRIYIQPKISYLSVGILCLL